MSELSDTVAVAPKDASGPEDSSITRPGDRLAAALRGFKPPGILAILLILAGNDLFVPLSAFLVFVWAWLSRTPWRDLGFVRPLSWLVTILTGVALGVCFKLAMKAVVMPFLGAPPITAYQFLVGNTAALPWMLYIIIAGAGFGEETVFRGWMFERLGRLLGQSTSAKTSIVLITSVWFALEHYAFQGMLGVEQAFIVGLVFGSVFAMTGSLFMLMIAHAFFDLTALALIFWDVEESVAHLIFK